MTLKEIHDLLVGTGLPVAYRAFEGRQEPPFLCYLVSGSENFYADNKTFLKIEHIQVELYTAEKDLESEEKVELALQQLCWEKAETFIESEQVYQITYEIEV